MSSNSTVLEPCGLPCFSAVQRFRFEHAGVALAGGQCYWVEITDATSTSSAFWSWGSGGNSRYVQDGPGGGAPPDGYDPTDVHTGNDLWFCLDIVWDVSDCAGAAPPPANDACADRIPIANGLTAMTTLGASTDGLATNGTGDCAVFGDPQIHNDVWFNYTAPVTGTLVVATCEGEGTGGSSGYDTKIAIYDGCSTVLCPYGGNEIGCNDDDAANGCAASFHATASAPITAGNCYKVRVGGFGPASAGAATLSVHN